MHACTLNCLEVLIEGGANPDIADHNRMTALEYAILSEGSESVDKLIRAGVNANKTLGISSKPLFAAAFSGKADIVRKLIKAGAALNASESHYPSIHVAAREGHTDCVKELIQAGAELNIVDRKGDTPLMAAAQSFSFNCVSTLLKAGAEFDTTHLAYMAIMTLHKQESQDSAGTVLNTYF